MERCASSAQTHMFFWTRWIVDSRLKESRLTMLDFTLPVLLVNATLGWGTGLPSLLVRSCELTDRGGMVAGSSSVWPGLRGGSVRWPKAMLDAQQQLAVKPNSTGREIESEIGCQAHLIPKVYPLKSQTALHFMVRQRISMRHSRWPRRTSTRWPATPFPLSLCQ